MLENKDYCDYETCVALRELGYPLTSKEVRYEDKAVFVPNVLLYSAQKWLREEHDMCVHICRPHMNKGSYVWSYEVVFCGCGVSSRGFFLSYEEALSEGVRESIKILQDEQKENN